MHQPKPAELGLSKQRFEELENFCYMQPMGMTYEGFSDYAWNHTHHITEYRALMVINFYRVKELILEQTRG